MPTYLVESYAPNPDKDPRRVALELRESPLARHRWSLLLPEEEICFHVLDGESAEAVRELVVRAGLRCDRITEAVPVPARDLECKGGTL
jgi:hypothetical protein